MDLHNTADLAQVVGGFALFISVLFLFFEVRTNNRLTRAANAQALVGLSSPFNLALIQDRKMAELYVQGAATYHEMDDIDRCRYRALLTWWLILHENIYYQWRQGLLDQHSFQPWANELRLFIKQQNLGARWPEMKGLFQAQFADHIHALIDGPAGPNGPQALDRAETAPRFPARKL